MKINRKTYFKNVGDAMKCIFGGFLDFITYSKSPIFLSLLSILLSPLTGFEQSLTNTELSKTIANITIDDNFR